MKELDGISAPVLLMAGDHDMVKLDHTVELHRRIKGSELAILPGTGHETPLLRPEWFAAIAIDFFATPLPEAATGTQVPKAVQAPAK